MGASQRRKGYEGERELVTILRAFDPKAHRVPLSGSTESYPGDVKGLGLTWEVKRRAGGEGFKQLYTWLEGADALAVRMDRREWLAVVPLRTLLELLTRKQKEGDAA